MRATTDRAAGPRDHACAVLALALAASACPRNSSALLTPDQQARTPPSIRRACALTEERCSRCHDLERIQLAHPGMVDWPVYVDRMRRMPGSGISGDDAPTIVRCLGWLEDVRRGGYSTVP